jgi:uncharacterized protein (UPF0212 family)
VLRKVNLETVQVSLCAVCPKCGKAISPAEVRRVDFERMECPACGERFASTRVCTNQTNVVGMLSILYASLANILPLPKKNALRFWVELDDPT